MAYLSQNIKLLRKAFGLSQAQLGEAVGVAKTTISGYETGSQPPQEYEKSRIAKRFHVSVEDLEHREYTIEEVDAIAERHGPKRLQDSNVTEDEPGVYQYKTNKQETDLFDVSLAVHTGKIISMILDKHRTPREYYAKEILKRDSRTLQRICKGEIMAGFDIILQVAIDHNEPLELFRLGPLPQGHLLTQLRDKETIIDTQRQLISTLQQKRA